jgi:hypothetical protein
MRVRLPAVLGAAVRENAKHRRMELVEEGDNPIVQEIGGSNRGFGRVELANGDLGIGINVSTLSSAADERHGFL